MYVITCMLNVSAFLRGRTVSLQISIPLLISSALLLTLAICLSAWSSLSLSQSQTAVDYAASNGGCQPYLPYYIAWYSTHTNKPYSKCSGLINHLLTVFINLFLNVCSVKFLLEPCKLVQSF